MENSGDKSFEFMRCIVLWIIRENFMTTDNKIQLCPSFIFIRSIIHSFVAENLQYLRLGDNNLHVIPSEALRPLHRLRHLDLRANNISVVLEDAFVGYGDSITFLNLQKNE